MNSGSRYSTSAIPTLAPITAFSALSRALTGARELAVAAGDTALDVVSAIRGLRARRAADRASERSRPIVAALTVHRPPAEVYAYYRDFTQLPTFMEHLISVRQVDPSWSHWIAALPTGTVAWDVKVIDDVPGELVAWRSVKGSVLDLRARVTFGEALGGDATDLRVELRVGDTRTRRGRTLARLFTATEVEADLRRLKHLVEAGAQLARSTAPASERRHGSHRQSRAAR